jgi:hypothetical protein
LTFYAEPLPEEVDQSLATSRLMFLNMTDWQHSKETFVTLSVRTGRAELSPSL